MTQGTIIPPEVDQDAIEYGHVYANYVKSVADTPGDPDADPDIVHVNGQVTFDSTFPGASARGSIRLPARPRAYGLIVTGDTFEIVNSKLVDHEGREGVRLIASVDGIPLSWQAVVTLQDSAGRTIYNKSYIIHHDLWDSSGELLHINLPDLIPTPSRLEPPEGAAVRAAERALEEIRALTDSNQQINLDIEGLKSEVVVLHGQTGDRLAAAEAARSGAEAARVEAETARTGAESARTGAESARDTANTHRAAAQAARTGAEGARDAADGSALAAGQSATSAGQSATSAGQSASDAAGSATGADVARAAAVVARTGAETARTGAEAAKTAAETAETEAETAKTAAEAARDTANTHRTAAQTARTGAEGARDAAEGYASDASGSASDANESKVQAQFARSSAETARDLAADHRQVASSASTTAQNARGQAQTAAHVASGHASDAAGSAAAAADERVVAQDAAVLAEGHAATADGHRVDAEAAAALAQSLRWVVKGAWSPGQYEAGDVVVYDERAYYAQTATSVEPPAQPWVPLTPAGGGGASHWDDLDGKPVVFPPEAHTHDAEDVSGAATPLLDVTEASVGAQSVGEALDATTEASRLEGALTDQVDASEAVIQYRPGGQSEAIASGLSEAVNDAAYLGNAAYQSMIGQVIPTLEALGPMFDGKADAEHTHDGADISGALTDQVDASGALVNYMDPVEGFAAVASVATLAEQTASALASASALYGMIQAKADADHTHDGADISGALTDQVQIQDTVLRVPLNPDDPASEYVDIPFGEHIGWLSNYLSEVGQRQAAAPATWYWSGTSLPTAASQVHAQARAGDFIVAPNLTTDPGWHRITGV